MSVGAPKSSNDVNGDVQTCLNDSFLASVGDAPRSLRECVPLGSLLDGGIQSG